MIPDTLSQGQFDTVYNFLSLVIASQLFTALFLLICLPRILPRYRQAVTVAIIVCGIAAYHYFRIFDSFKEAFVTDAVGGDGTYVQAAGASFNEGYRYVDWVLTVPLLLVELIAVLALASTLQSKLLRRLVPAAVAMIALGYPGEISDDTTVRTIFFVLSMIPFLYILYVLFVQLTASLDLQPAGVRSSLSNLRWLLVISWTVYPIAYLIPMLDVSGADAWVGKQIGYSVADIAAKAVYALIIYRVARIKSFDDDPEFTAVEASHGSPAVATRTSRATTASGHVETADPAVTPRP